MNWSLWESFTIQDIPRIVTGFACRSSFIVLIFIVGWMAYCGIKFLTSFGNPTAFSQAKTNFYWSIVGTIVIFGVYTIIVTVATFVGYQGFSLVPLSCP